MKFINKLKLYTIYIVVGFLAWTTSASAELSINEIMYDNAGADIDWLEIYNGGSESVDLTAIKLLISNSPSNHEINGYSGAKEISPGGYGVIVVNSQLSGFLAKWPDLTPLFTSAFSLPNLQDDSSASVSINNGDRNIPIVSVTYSKASGASDNGQSLQLISGVWQESVPTPTRENYFNQDVREIGETQNNSIAKSTTKSSSSSSPGTKKEALPELKITTEIIASSVVVSGLPFEIESKTSTNRDTTLMTGRYVWNFGDGTKKESDRAGKFSHIYYYPGDHLMSLAYYQSKGSFEPIATNRLIVKVIAPSVTISSVGNYDDPYIELENKGSHELELSGFTISSMRHYFVIPEGTIILPNKKIILSAKVTGFSYEDIGNLFIKNPSGEIVDRFPKESENDVSTPIVQRQISVRSDIAPIRTENKIEKIQLDETKQDSSIIIDLDSLNNQNNFAASSADSNFHLSSMTSSLIGLLLVMVLGIASYLMIKKSNSDDDPLDKSIKAKDFTIIE